MESKKVPKVEQKKVKWINPLKDKTRVVPFRVPDQQDRMAALGTLVGEKWRLKKSLQAILKFFQPIKKPQPLDHLYQYEEDGQSYDLYTSVMKNYIDKEKEVVYLALFHCTLSKERLSWIKKNVKHFFLGVKVKIHHIQPVGLQAFGEQTSENGEKYYDAAKLNQYFRNHLPKNAYSMAIITSLLIYNGDNPQEQLKERYVFGLGCVKDRMSVISLEEIVKHGYGSKRPEGVEDEDDVNMDFLLKVVNHELCHTFGIRHCIHYTCLMNGSNGYNEAITKFGQLCPVCVRKLQHNIGFDMSERYAAMGDEFALQLHEAIEASFSNIKEK